MKRELAYQLERTVTIRAHRDLVFRYFTDSARWASWWGEGSTIEPHVGGRVVIRYPGGTEAVGEVVELRPPERIAFTYGYSKGTPVAPGESQVTIRLEAIRDGTRLHLSHAFADAAIMQEHTQGWRYQLSLFANVVANELHRGATATVDQWFAMWSNPNDDARSRELDQLVTSHVSMQDRFSAIQGIADLRAHLDAVHRFMPGFELRRDGDVRHCQGYVLASWIGRGSDGQTHATGSTVFTLTADARIESVTGFWTT
jgi:uncharacterized protein YndB with AHSA1/START domain